MFENDDGTSGLEGLADFLWEPLRIHNEHRKAGKGPEASGSPLSVP